LEFLKRSLDADISLAVTPVVLSMREMPGKLGGDALDTAGPDRI